MLKWGSGTPISRLRRFFSAGRGGGEVQSMQSVPTRRSPLRRPKTVKREIVPENWCSFIGRITAPVRLDRYKTGAFTFLEVNGHPRNPTKSPFGLQQVSFIPLWYGTKYIDWNRVCVSMKGELAQVALQYLQKNQYVYVSGCFHSYNKINLVHYTVDVEELNYVRTQSQNEVPVRSDDKLKNEEMTFSASASSSGSYDINKEEWIKERHILWQIFFANPFEWWDRRARKSSPKQPDFKHKSTGEALWIRSDDPPWVKKQLSLYDSEISTTNLFRKKDDFGLQGWKMQDFDHL